MGLIHEKKETKKSRATVNLSVELSLIFKKKNFTVQVYPLYLNAVLFLFKNKNIPVQVSLHECAASIYWWA